MLAAVAGGETMVALVVLVVLVAVALGREQVA